MLKRVKAKHIAAIAFLLIGGVVLGSIVLPTETLGNGNVGFHLEGPFSNLNWHPGTGWEDANKTVSCYVMADYLDANGNFLGTLSVSGTRSPDGNNRVTYSASASAYGAKGRANAWVQVPGNWKAHDQGGPGADRVNWNDPNLPDGMSAWDSCSRHKNGVGNKRMEASAALGANGARVRIGFTASNI